MKSKKLLNSFELLPDHKDSEYTIILSSLVIPFTYNDLLNQFFPIIEDKELALSIRFAAYYSCSIFFRRNNKFEEMIKLADMYSRYFVQYPLNDIVLSFKYRYMALEYHSIDLMQISISYALKAKKALEHHKAILHHFAETIATGLEYNLIKNDDKSIFILEAFNAINESIELWNVEPSQKKYAKNYATLGRLYIQNGDFDNGKSNILKFLNYEDGDTVDSLKRIIKYNNYLYNAQYEKSVHNLHNEEIEVEEKLKMKLVKISQELENSKVNYIEFLAFFSSIIAILSCSTSLIANADNFNIAACLIVILCGVIIFSFNIFSIILEWRYQTKRKYIVFAIISVFSMCLIFIGLFLGFKLNL